MTTNGHGHGRDPSQPHKELDELILRGKPDQPTIDSGLPDYGQSVPLNWQAGALYVKERRARLIVEARYLGMRVKCLEKGKLYKVTVPASKKHKEGTEHIIKRNALGLLCNCTWAEHRPYDACKHTACVEDYLNNLPLESEGETKDER